jgi:RsmE family RNA methyltransferase
LNLVLFEAAEMGRLLPREDPRARHLLSVLGCAEGESFDAGLVDGPRGRGTLGAIRPEGLHLEFVWGPAPAPLDPLVFVIGLPRPQTARKILQEATALGVGALHFVTTEKGEANYAQSSLWQSGEWRRHLKAGAEQAFTTRLPPVTWGRPLAEVLRDAAGGTRIALDNYEAETPLRAAALAAPVTVAIGPERGWSAAERGLLRGQGFVLAHLGARVLRTETACVAAAALIRARLGWD